MQPVRALRRWVGKRVDPHARYCQALRLASSHGNLAIVKLLLADARPLPLGVTLLLADARPSPLGVKLLLADARPLPLGGTGDALRDACAGGHLAVLDCLLSDPRIEAVCRLLQLPAVAAAVGVETTVTTIAVAVATRAELMRDGKTDRLSAFVAAQTCAPHTAAALQQALWDAAALGDAAVLEALLADPQVDA